MLDNEYRVCVGFSKLLGDLSSKLGVETQDLSVYVDVGLDAIKSDEFVLPDFIESRDGEKKVVLTEHAGHARRHVHIVDPKYGIDGYFSTDPANDTRSEEKNECNYTHMIRRILINNDFEKFLNSNRKLSYPKDMVDISLFSKYISFLKTSNSFVYNVENPVDLLYSFRDEYKTKENSIAYDIIYDAILNVSDLGYIPSLNDNKDNLKNLLFIEALKEKILTGENTNNLVESFINSKTSKRK